VSQGRQRCRQCGWSFDPRPERLPRRGVRLRCPECGGLFPVLRPPSDDARSLEAAPPQAGRGPVALPRLPTAAARLTARPAQGEAEEIVRLWLREISRSETRPLTERLIYSEYGAELARLLSMWQASYPDADAMATFRQELMSALARVESGDAP